MDVDEELVDIEGDTDAAATYNLHQIYEQSVYVVLGVIRHLYC